MADIIDKCKILIHERNLLTKKMSRLKRRRRRLNKGIEGYTKAKKTLERIVELAQDRLKSQLEGIITMAVQSVFNRDIKFVFDIEKSLPMLIEDGEKFSPKDEIGGSLIDIVSITLRVVLMLMVDPPVRPILFADEPFKHSGELQKEGAKVITEISRESGIQFIIVTHSSDIAAIADRHFTATRKWKISKVIRRRK